MNKHKILVGRPRISADFAIVLHLRDEQNLGWSPITEDYRNLNGKHISRDTVKRRYFEARRMAESSAHLVTGNTD